MFMKGHDKSEAKILLILIAIFGLILGLILIIIILVCWKESVKEREAKENAQLSHQMVMYENQDFIASG